MANLKIWLAGGAVLGLAAVNGFLMVRSSRMEAEMGRMKTATEQEITALRQHSAQNSAATRKTIEELNQQLSENQNTAGALAAMAKVNAQKHAERLVAGLADKQKSLDAERQEETARSLKQLDDRAGEARQAVETVSGKVTEVANEVGAVRAEVATAKTAIDTTIADLKSVRGDMGVQSGLIATNSKELAALRQLGERGYYEFTLTKASRQAKIAGLVIAMKKADSKRNKFSLDVLADDRKVEKKDKTINEPVQFYVAGARQPYELVVNQVGKDLLVGYVAVPKVLQARALASN